MTDINKNLVTICGDSKYYEPSFDWTGMDSWGRFDSSNFSSMVRVFRNSPLSSITPAECDFIFNGLLRDTQLRYSHPKTWNNLAKYLTATIQHLLSKPGVHSPTNSSPFAYRLEYAKFMNARQNFRTSETESVIANYNKIVVEWRFPKA